jgi:hypothetical protein
VDQEDVEDQEDVAVSGVDVVVVDEEVEEVSRDGHQLELSRDKPSVHLATSSLLDS